MLTPDPANHDDSYRYNVTVQNDKFLVEDFEYFYENKLTYKGKYFNDLSGKDKAVFRNHMVSVAEVNETDKKTVLKYFLMLNRTGKAMDQSHLNEVEQMLRELE